MLADRFNSFDWSFFSESFVHTIDMNHRSNLHTEIVQVSTPGFESSMFMSHGDAEVLFC